MNAMISALKTGPRRRMRLVFEHAFAFSADRAIAFEPRSAVERRYFEELLAAGALAEVRPGVYRGVRDKRDEVDAARRKRVLAIAGGVLAIGAAILGISQL